MFGLSALATKAIIAAVLAAVFVAGWLWITTHYYNKGWNAHVEVVNEANRKAKTNADANQKQLDECIARGGEWDTSVGLCR